MKKFNNFKIRLLLIIILNFITLKIFAENYYFKNLFYLKNGNSSNCVKWINLTTHVPPGIFNGPTAIYSESNNNFVISDPLNYRIIILNINGKLIKEIDLLKLKSDYNLPNIPAIIDIGVVLPELYYLADAKNKNILILTRTGELVNITGSSGEKYGQFRQINKLNVDGAGNAYITDLSLNKTCVYNLKGEWIADYIGFTNISVDLYGNIYQIEYEKNPSERTIVIYNEKGNVQEILARIKDKFPIKYIKPLGFDKYLNFYLTYDTEYYRKYLKIDTGGRTVLNIKLPLFSFGIDMLNPDWVSPEGEIYSIKLINNKFWIRKLVKK